MNARTVLPKRRICWSVACGDCACEDEMRGNELGIDIRRGKLHTQKYTQYIQLRRKKVVERGPTIFDCDPRNH